MNIVCGIETHITYPKNKLKSFSEDNTPSAVFSVRCLCALPAEGAVSAGPQLHCHVQPPVWALLLDFPDSLKSHK